MLELLDMLEIDAMVPSKPEFSDMYNQCSGILIRNCLGDRVGVLEKVAMKVHFSASY